MAIENKPKPNTNLETKEKILPTSERNQRIKDKMLIIVTSILNSEKKKEKIIEFQNEIVTRVNYLKSKYPDCQNYTIIHALSGSSIYVSDTNIIEDDFPGDDSIEKFVDDLYKRYNTTKSDI